MKKTLMMAVACALSLSLNQAAAKAEVEITWDKPEDFTDVKPSNESRKRFQERTFRELDKYLLKLAESLPEGQKLQMTVTDLDLAGQVWPSYFVGLGHSGSDVRLIKRIYIPRMTFTYTLTDASGQLLQEGDVKLKDMSFQDRTNLLFRNDNLRYEKNMLKDWFTSEFPSLIAKN